MSKKSITIVGAGLVGSLLAIYLSRKGYPVSIYERRPDMRLKNMERGRSINLALSDRGLRALHDVGLEDDIKKITIPMKGRMVHLPDGSTNFQAYSTEGHYINSVARGELNMLLMNEAENAQHLQINFNHRCTALNAIEGKLTFFDAQTNTTKNISSDLIFGADGAFSSIRSNMPFTDGFSFEYQQNYLNYSYKELTIEAGKNGEWPIEKNCLHIWPRKNFMLIALPNLDGSFTVTLFLANKGAESFANLQTPNQVNTFFETFFSDALPLMPNLISDFFENPTGSLLTIKCFPWVISQNLALIGDAAHAIVPFYGQGMNAGFEDCYVLNNLINKHSVACDEPDWNDILNEYQQLRKPDGDAIADLALHNFIEMRDLVADPNFLLRKSIENYLHQKFPAQYSTLYSMVTFSTLRYSEAQAIFEKQNRLFEKIFAIPNLAARWYNGELYEEAKNWLNTFLTA